MEIEPFVMFVYAVAWLMTGVSGTSIFYHFKFIKETKKDIDLLEKTDGVCEFCG